MALIYQITEPEMNSLFDQLRLETMRENNMVGPEGEKHYTKAHMHRAFHMVTVRWAQEMGFKGFRN